MKPADVCPGDATDGDDGIRVSISLHLWISYLTHSMWITPYGMMVNNKISYTDTTSFHNFKF